MKAFPNKLSLPIEIEEARLKRKRAILKSLRVGILIRLLIVLAELTAVYFSNSSALLLDALSSAVDIGSSLMLVIFIWLAERPPDENHPFGHGRYEPLIGLQMGLLLAVIGAISGFQQVTFIQSNETLAPMPHYTFLVPALAMLLLELSYRYMIRTAKKEHSPALEADAVHFRVDALTSLVALVALVAGIFAPSYSHVLDHYGAIIIAIFMLVIGLIAARSNLNQLLDKTPEQHFFDSVKEAAKSVDGVKDTEKLRIMQYGPDAHVDIDIEVDPDLNVEVAHAISQKVRLAIQQKWPAVRDVIVHVEPYYPNDH